MSRDRTALVTGGAGYIGSHTCVALLEAGWSVIVLDNYANSSPKALDRVQELVPSGDLERHEVDLLDVGAVERVVSSRPIDVVVHFAGLKAVGESLAEPLRYYRNNLTGTVNLLGAMRTAGVFDLVFSSSCTVYGEPDASPIDESAPLHPMSPYGRTKLAVEHLLTDLAGSGDPWRAALLRYFNPVGAHPSGRIGEDPKGIPGNLMPYAMQVAAGQRDELVVFGDDYPTADGTCIRDYIHVDDLAAGHLAAIDALDRITGARPVNLGTGTGSSVLDVVSAVSATIGRPLPHRVGDRRPGDVAALWAEPTLARDLLGWQASRTLADACADHWHWQSSNPGGYEG